ncbi:hypothetical protein QA639_21025 [Bradyrhizobium pachyrhizi]|uniref:hypothetical protein n=1 Tax=Bradyrhizobium pachyrhizi TaxID=280333 RepID=UPI0024B229B7|nr:hypothetical protein [Bradyrhizobium pachyrhizi]WFU52193.1 hypothetical protein QA639_21025 [Bradyrhizobium pachyrhizi]
MNPKLLPADNDLDGQMIRIVEETGEVLQAMGKIGRFGILSHHPDGGQNNAAHLLSELADLRHAISVAEGNLTDHAKVVILQEGGYRHELVWTDTLITTAELRELIGDEEHDNDLDFAAASKSIPVCAGEWHREGMDWRFYVDSELD